MAYDVRVANPSVNVEILGVNRSSDTDPSCMALATEELSLPWLQDTATEQVWNRWHVTYRDLAILDPQNRVLTMFNLTDHDLTFPTNRAALKQLLLDVASLADSDRDQLPDDWERANFGDLSAAPEQDPDGDGRDNFSECAFGTDPNNADSRTSFRTTITGVGAARKLQVTFQRRAGSYVTYVIETSPDLITWTSSPANYQMVETFRNLFDGTGIGRATCTLTAPIPSQSRAFLRVRAVPRAL